jgi:hypothetical protein
MRYLHSIVILPVVLMFGAAGSTVGQELSGRVIRSEIRSDHDVVITYSLNAPSEAEYDVDLFLVWGSGNRQKLEKVTGDIGSGIRAGGMKTIHWDMKSELPEPIAGMSYRFEVEITRSSGIPWYWYAGGGAVVGGVVYLILKPKPTPPDDHESTIPLPPGR